MFLGGPTPACGACGGTVFVFSSASSWHVLLGEVRRPGSTAGVRVIFIPGWGFPGGPSGFLIQRLVAGLPGVTGVAGPRSGGERVALLEPSGERVGVAWWLLRKPACVLPGEETQGCHTFAWFMRTPGERPPVATGGGPVLPPTQEAAFHKAKPKPRFIDTNARRQGRAMGTRQSRRWRLD